MMKKILQNECGFMLLNVVFLTLITSFAAMILMNAAPRLKNPQAVLRLTATHLANEQFAFMEYHATQGDSLTKIYIPDKELTTTNAGAGKPITFTISVSPVGGNSYKVKVEWTVDGREDFLEFERTIYVK